jgi:hypothetical protein
MPARKSRRDRNAWLIAWILTVLLHGAAVLGFRNLPVLHPAATTIHRSDPIQLVFTQPPPGTKKADAKNSDTPHFFTELPPDRADTPPVKADFLSNVTSRARDRVPGGESNLPRMKGEGDMPMVALGPKGNPSPPSPATPPAPQSTGRADTRAVKSTQPDGSKGQNPVGTGRAGTAAPQHLESPAPAPSDAHPPGVAGSSGAPQPEMDNPGGNAALTGDISLNTVAWNYAPWLMRFRMQLLERWIAPPAYYYGILKEGGWAVIEVEISPSGQELRLQVLEQQGHPSLITAAESAVRSMSPIEPLPSDFPEPTLILRIRMVYPKIRPR